MRSHSLYGLIMIVCGVMLVGCDTTPKGNWYKGNTHTHTLWSDGNDFPDMIASWYREADYNFLVLSDHNVLSRGDRWMNHQHIIRRGGKDALAKYKQKFGNEWVQTRGEDKKLEVRLKPLTEVQQKLEVPDQFIMIEGEEITDRFGVAQIHTNAANLLEPIPPQRGKGVRETMRRNLQAVIDQSKKHGKPMIAHLNHPNFHYSITAEDMAHVLEQTFFEVYNGHTGTGNAGDAIHASTERMWDIANTIRLTDLNARPMYGIASDDAHHYHGHSHVSITGRGWVMVRSETLNADAIITAMQKGDFYCSTGVELSTMHYDAKKRKLTVAVKPEPGVRYNIKFIGTLRGTQLNPQPVKGKNGKPLVDANGRPLRLTQIYSKQVGMTLKEFKGGAGVFHLPPNVLYVRALITSTKAHPRPSEKGQVEKAWTQPVGWETIVK